MLYIVSDIKLNEQQKIFSWALRQQSSAGVNTQTHPLQIIVHSDAFITADGWLVCAQSRFPCMKSNTWSSQ